MEEIKKIQLNIIGQINKKIQINIIAKNIVFLDSLTRNSSEKSRS